MSQIPNLPRWLVTLLTAFVPRSMEEELLGDLEELHADRCKQRGSFIANLLLFVDMVHLSLGFGRRKTRARNASPWGHYLLVSRRNLLRNRSYLIVNLLGLTGGMAVCLLIAQYLSFELSFDRFHSDGPNTYRLYSTSVRNGQALPSETSFTYGLAAEASATIPEVVSFCRVRPVFKDEGCIISNPRSGAKFLEDDKVWYVDPTFLELFNFPLQSGHDPHVLSQPNSIVITQEAATKLFGRDDPIGQTLHMGGGTITGDFIVTGVLQALPGHTHLDFDYLLPLQFLLENNNIYVRGDGWEWQNFVTYVQLTPSADLFATGAKFEQILEAHLDAQHWQSNSAYAFGFQKLQDIHLGRFDPNEGLPWRLWFFGLIAVLILLIAWFNYINLSTVQALRRAKEVGLRKTLGANRRAITQQFLVESWLLNSLAAMMSVIAAYALLPVLHDIVGNDMPMSLYQDGRFWAVLVLTIAVGSVLSGLYPAFVLASLSPLRSLQTNQGVLTQRISLRKVLLTMQFLASALLIAGTYVIFRQVEFMRSQVLGIDMEQLVIVPGPRAAIEQGWEIVTSQYEVFRNEVKAHHAISSICGTSNVPGEGTIFTGNMRRLGAPSSEDVFVDVVLVDVAFTDTYDFKFIEGQPFQPEVASYGGVLLNDKARQVLDMGTPAAALEESLVISGYDTLPVQGVVENVNWFSLDQPQVPIIYALVHDYNSYFSIRVSASDIPGALAHIEDTYRALFPDDPYTGFFLDEHFDQQYRADLQFGRLFITFASVAVFIACIGLFALVSHAATVRTKELGIRKVLGAGLRNVMLLISKEYLILLGIAHLVALPIFWWAANTWLENYPYRVGITWDILLVPGVLLTFIAALTVLYRTYLSANANPVDSLRAE
ncbi:MAG: ABC transporter permease [Bacteroidota bacterium]